MSNYVMSRESLKGYPTHQQAETSKDGLLAPTSHTSTGFLWNIVN